MLVVIQLLGHVQLCVTPWTAARQASLSFTISWSLLKLMSIESMMPSNHLILCRLLRSIFSSISLFQWVGSSHPVVKTLELQLRFTIFSCIFHRVLLIPLAKSCVEFLSPVLRVQIVASGGQAQVDYSYIHHHNKKTTLLEFVLNELVHEAYRKCSTKYCRLFSNWQYKTLTWTVSILR